MSRTTPLLLALLTMLLTGCGESGSTPAGGRAVTLAMIPKGTTHEHWKSVHAGALKAAEEMDARILWKGPLKEDDRAQQIAVVESMVVQGVDGILLAPLDDVALVPPAEEAVRKKIPVVLFDSGFKSDLAVSYVATDNRRGGAMAGDHLVQLLGGKGRVILLRYQEGSASTAEREAGFLDALARHPAVQIVSSDQYAGATTDTAYQKSEQLLARFKQPDGSLAAEAIFTVNESATFGMSRALEDAGLIGKVIHIGFDASPKLIAAVKDQRVAALVIQDPIQMGYLAVKTMVDHLRGLPVQKTVDTGVYLVTRQSLNDPKIQSVLQSRAD
jgi:ribose transport system substrate-binding protein